MNRYDRWVMDQVNDELTKSNTAASWESRVQNTETL